MTTVNSGIYAITNVITGEMYHGSSNNLTKRKARHWSDLRRNKHANAYLQNAWNKGLKLSQRKRPRNDINEPSPNVED